MIRAAARGVIDFRTYRARDVNWWRKTNLLLDALANDSYVQRLKTMFDHQCALVGVPGLTDESYQDIKKSIGELLPLILEKYSPWLVKSGTDSAVEALIDEYKRTIGDPADPEFRRKLQQDLAEAERKRQERLANFESEDDRIDRLIQERDRRNAERLKTRRT